MEKKQVIQMTLKLILIIALSVVLCLVLNTKTETKNLSYDKFLKMVENKEIKEVSINLDESKFVATDNNKQEYSVENPKYDNFKKDLLESGIKVKEKKKFNTSIIFTLFQVGLMFAMAIMVFNTLSNQGKGNTMTIMPQDKELNKVDKTTFKDVAGLKQVKEDLQLLIDFLKDPKRFSDAGAKMPKGIVLYGPPGTGKTLLAKAIAGEANVPFYSVSGSDFIEMFVGVGAKRVRELFKNAKKNAPCIVFIDELDAVGGARDNSSTNSEHRQTLNALLSEMDGFSGNSGVLVIAATNRIEDLDSALIRPGRFDKHIAVPLPDTVGDRLAIINIYKENKKFAEDVDFNALAKETLGESPADIEALLNEAALISVKEGKNFIDKKCIDDAIYKKLLRGHAKDDKNRNEEELKLVAWHEAGHATIAKACGMNVSKVTIVSSTSGAGGVNIIIPKKMGLYSKEELMDEVKMAYGGRCAELLLYDNDESKISTGASADIQRATNIIKEMITSYGMVEDFGLLSLNELNVDDKVIIEESIKLSKKLKEEAMLILKKYKSAHEEIVEKLLEKETIDEKELDEIWKKYCE